MRWGFLKRLAEGALRHYGSDCVVTGPDGMRVIRALIQPLRYDGSDSDGFGAAGRHDTREYLLMTPPAPDAPAIGEIVEAGGVRYAVRSVREAALGGEGIYVWAVLRKAYEGGTDDGFI